MRILAYCVLLLSLVACNKPSPNTLVIGTIAGPETELVETAQEVAKNKYDLNIKIVTFNDYNLPNEALQDGSLDANVYQHLPYLNAAVKAHGYTLEAIGRTFVYPMGIYSKKYKSLNQLPENAIIALPNDPSNEMRALQLLEKAQLITLKTTQNTGLKDIATNPHNLQFKEMDAAQLPRVLPDVDAAVINTTFALPAGLNPSHDALFSEDKDSPYANIIVIRSDSPKKEQLELFVKALNSEEVKEKAKTLFGDSAIPAW
ncbi:MetQ/NlpA family ABC transporter substrate-binding protein [Fluoribacter gormanii]|uniref:D-methionine transport system substrate-binding protein n=1 Tax=Fluoribacter gormanii TaxID=464 RepID=A0A377GIF5_9GAMM|nr:MetQ/NlpA family ABC transporter substrate-binding protein [Fluoribacter gormanii]KTD03357.1 D-methionine-binding lipoprotein MetQ [Fluoribacter gormanii]MCW8444054.1 MetQ/NlpA family ABC transporter substrate-binding protein [Fluoribacter gormanii]MCW8469236.1 MetQ/NlpA family ABC transporter substrate-binding protein [Fluoribacter gormanii]SIQ52162.1 D-methionine transport system substrate-binding protein [Fluoribacter gormanii]STO24384.1 D-methionine-binding lipoprotein metQ precursor [F